MLALRSCNHLRNIVQGIEPRSLFSSAGQLRFVAASVAEGLEPKTVRNLWGVVSLVWNAALAQKYVDAMLPKPKLPRRTKKRARFYTLSDVAKMIAASRGEQRVFYWLAAETGLRAGEL